MKKLVLGIAWGAVFFIFPSRAHAIQFSIPYITAQSTTIANAALVFSTNVAPSPYMNCLEQFTVSDTIAGTFGISFSTVTSTGGLSPATTTYSVILSSGVPFDKQWPNLGAYCGPPGTQMRLFVTSGNYTISADQFTSKGMAP